MGANNLKYLSENFGLVPHSQKFKVDQLKWHSKALMTTSSESNVLLLQSNKVLLY